VSVQTDRSESLRDRLLPVRSRVAQVRWYRMFALASTLVVMATYLSVFHEVTTVAGGTGRLLVVVAGAFVAATLLATFVTERTAGIVGLAMVVLGGVWYLLSAPSPVGTWLGAVITALGDTVALSTGRQVIEITAVSRWAAATAPAPVFLSWYFAMRRRYALAAAIGGSMVCFFLLTTDLQLGGLVGVAAAVFSIGFGELDRRDGARGQAELLVVLVAVMTAAALFLPVLPASKGSTLEGFGTGGAEQSDGPTAIENNLLATDTSLSIQGSISLSPAVRFTVRADELARWRVATYDRYTGDGWVRTDSLREYEEPLDGPPGLTRRNEQRFRLESESAVMPAAATPVSVGPSVRDRTFVTEHGSLVSASTLPEGASYSVVSRSPIVSEATLSRADGDVPDDIDDRYTQVPGSTPDRVAALTADLTAAANSSYEAATLVERYLERQKEYSLDVERPDGDVADSFLFEMEAGYCTYYATTMVTMLRTQAIPARLAVGYNTGQRVSEGKWVVRGSDAHAWVEVYVAGVGWVEFDPTPAAGWTEARQEALSSARNDELRSGDVDTPETTNGSYARPERADEPTADEEGEDGAGTDSNGTDSSDGPGADAPAIEQRGRPGVVDSGPRSVPADRYRQSDDGWLAALAARSPWLALGLVFLVGVVAGSRRLRLVTRAKETTRLYWHRPSDDPDSDAIRAAGRIETALATEHRPRRATETRREYREALPATVDKRVDRVFELADRAEYGDGITAAERREAIEHADKLVRQLTPLRRVLRQSVPGIGA